MNKIITIGIVFFSLLLSSCDAFTYMFYNPDSCSHGEARKGKLKGKDWSDLKNHQ